MFCKWLKHLCVASLLIFVSGLARAQYTVPESGWYWNPVVGGTGVNMEFQDTSMVLAYYAYSSNGQSAFFTVQGTYDVINRRVVGDLYTFQGGQCIGCPYVAPTAVKIGTATIQFSSLSTATITFATAQGTASFAVQRYVFTLSYYPTRSDEKKGLWAFTAFPSNTLPYGDALAISGTVDGTGGVKLGVGTYYPSNRPVVGQPVVPAVGGVNYLMLIDFSSTSYVLYSGEWSLGHFLGRYEIYPKTGSPTFAGVLALGSKIAGPSTLNQIIGASSLTQSENHELREKSFLTSSKQVAEFSSSDREILLEQVRRMEIDLMWQQIKSSVRN